MEQARKKNTKGLSCEEKIDNILLVIYLCAIFAFVVYANEYL